MTIYYHHKPNPPFNAGETSTLASLTAAQIATLTANGTIAVWGGGTPRPVEPPRPHERHMPGRGSTPRHAYVFDGTW